MWGGQSQVLVFYIFGLHQRPTGVWYAPISSEFDFGRDTSLVWLGKYVLDQETPLAKNIFLANYLALRQALAFCASSQSAVHANIKTDLFFLHLGVGQGMIFQIFNFKFYIILPLSFLALDSKRLSRLP